MAPDVAPPISYRTGAERSAVRRVEEAHRRPTAFASGRRTGPDGLLAVNVPEWQLVAVVPPDRAHEYPVRCSRRERPKALSSTTWSQSSRR